MPAGVALISAATGRLLEVVVRTSLRRRPARPPRPSRPSKLEEPPIVEAAVVGVLVERIVDLRDVVRIIGRRGGGGGGRRRCSRGDGDKAGRDYRNEQSSARCGSFAASPLGSRRVHGISPPSSAAKRATTGPESSPRTTELEAGREQPVDVLVEEVQADHERDDHCQDADRVVAEVTADLAAGDRQQDQSRSPECDLQPGAVVVEPAVAERVLDLTGWMPAPSRRASCRPAPPPPTRSSSADPLSTVATSLSRARSPRSWPALTAGLSTRFGLSLPFASRS